MKSINFSNSKIDGLTPLDFYRNEKIKHFSVGGFLTELLMPTYKNLVQSVIGNKINETFKDFPLTKEQTEQIMAVFEKQIDNTLPLIEPVEGRRYKSWTLEWKGRSYDMNLSLISPKSRSIQDFYEIITIAEECLAENKPMYLSIE